METHNRLQFDNIMPHTALLLLPCLYTSSLDFQVPCTWSQLPHETYPRLPLVQMVLRTPLPCQWSSGVAIIGPMGHRPYHFSSMVANSVTVLQKCCFEENQEKKSPSVPHHFSNSSYATAVETAEQ